MVRRQIDRFFTVLARELNRPATIILTGAAAGSLWGSIRPSRDIDFAIRLSRTGGRSWDDVEAAVARTVRLTGIAANYAEDIDRWSSISFLDYQRHTTPYRTFGRLHVRVLNPAYWSIGKVARLWPSDIDDLVAVLKRRRIAPQRLVRLWANAIRHSPRSPALTSCRQQVEGFLRSQGQTVWGLDFDVDAIIRLFRRALATPSIGNGRR